MRRRTGQILRRKPGVAQRISGDRGAASLSCKGGLGCGKVTAKALDQTGALRGAGDGMHRGGWGKVGHGTLH